MGLLVNNAGMSYDHSEYLDEMDAGVVPDMVTINALVPTMVSTCHSTAQHSTAQRAGCSGRAPAGRAAGLLRMRGVAAGRAWVCLTLVVGGGGLPWWHLSAGAFYRRLPTRTPAHTLRPPPCAPPLCLVQLCHMVVKGMRERGRGAIVNVGSGVSTVMPQAPLLAGVRAARVRVRACACVCVGA